MQTAPTNVMAASFWPIERFENGFTIFGIKPAHFAKARAIPRSGARKPKISGAFRGPEIRADSLRTGLRCQPSRPLQARSRHPAPSFQPLALQSANAAPSDAGKNALDRHHRFDRDG